MAGDRPRGDILQYIQKNIPKSNIHLKLKT